MYNKARYRKQQFTWFASLRDVYVGDLKSLFFWDLLQQLTEVVGQGANGRPVKGVQRLASLALQQLVELADLLAAWWSQGGHSYRSILQGSVCGFNVTLRLRGRGNKRSMSNKNVKTVHCTHKHFTFVFESDGESSVTHQWDRFFVKFLLYLHLGLRISQTLFDPLHHGIRRIALGNLLRLSHAWNTRVSFRSQLAPHIVVRLFVLQFFECIVVNLGTLYGIVSLLPTLLGQIKKPDCADKLACVRWPLLAGEVINWGRPESFLSHLLELSHRVTSQSVGGWCLYLRLTASTSNNRTI